MRWAYLVDSLAWFGYTLEQFPTCTALPFVPWGHSCVVEGQQGPIACLHVVVSKPTQLRSGHWIYVLILQHEENELKIAVHLCQGVI